MKESYIYYEIKPPRGLASINLPELWRFRELLYIFTWRDIKVRYKQTFIGIAWAVFQPFITMVIFSIFFGTLAKVPSDGVPYPIFVYSGLLLWTYFSSALTNSSNCLIDNENIIKKVYFPRLILPVATTVTPLVDFFFAFLILIGMMFFYHYPISFWTILILPILLLTSLFTASGLGLLLASINVKFRDVRYILPFFIQILMYITPVIYPSSIIPEKYIWIIKLNPMTGVIDTARNLLLHRGSFDITQVGLSLGISIVFLIAGVTYFRKTERFFADIL